MTETGALNQAEMHELAALLVQGEITPQEYQVQVDRRARYLVEKDEEMA